MSSPDSIYGTFSCDPFREALHDNLTLLADLLDTIRSECAQVDERPAELFFAGISTLVEAFIVVQFAGDALSADFPSQLPRLESSALIAR